MKAASGQEGDYYRLTWKGNQDARRKQEEEESSIHFPEGTAHKEAIRKRDMIKGAYLDVNQWGGYVLRMKKEQEDEANLLIWDRPKKMKGVWEMDGVPVFLQPDDIKVGADAIGWNVEVGKRDGRTYQRGGRVYRRIRVRSDQEPPSRFINIRGCKVTVNPIRSWKEREAAQSKGGEKCTKQRTFTELVAEIKPKKIQGEGAVQQIIRAKEKTAEAKTRGINVRAKVQHYEARVADENKERAPKLRRLEDEEIQGSTPKSGRETVTNSPGGGLEELIRTFTAQMEQMRQEMQQSLRDMEARQDEKIAKMVESKLNEGWEEEDEDMDDRWADREEL